MEKRNRGRPRKENCKVSPIKYMATEKEKREISEFSMLCKMSMSDFLREAVEEKKNRVRSKYGFRGSTDDEIYEEYDDFEDFDDIY